MDKDVIRGILSNSIGLCLLGILGWKMNLSSSAAISLSLNWAVCCIHAIPNNSEKFFDATGSVTYFTLVCSAIVLSGASALRQLVDAALVLIWCIRLGSFLLARILRDGKDDRFTELKKVQLRFVGVWTIQALWCFLVASPALITIRSSSCSSKPGMLDLVGWGVWVGGFAFEVIADKQKEAFRRDPANKSKFITHGLWAYSRHPNYFGEICMWIGICISGSSCFYGAEWLAWLSPATTWLLLMKVSGVPLVEGKGEKLWGDLPEYQWYMKHTPCIVPALRRPPEFSSDGYVSLGGS